MLCRALYNPFARFGVILEIQRSNSLETRGDAQPLCAAHVVLKGTTTRGPKTQLDHKIQEDL